MNNQTYINKLGNILQYTEILKRELEEERDESLENLKYEIEEELLTQYYKKILISIYRMRNNSAALLLKEHCTCKDLGEEIGIYVHGVCCAITKQALKNILQNDYEEILEKNITDDVKDIFTEEDTTLDLSEVKDIPEMLEDISKEDISDMKKPDQDVKSDIDDTKEEQNNIEVPGEPFIDELPDIDESFDFDEQEVKEKESNKNDSIDLENYNFFDDLQLTEDPDSSKAVETKSKKEDKPIKVVGISEKEIPISDKKEKTELIKMEDSENHEISDIQTEPELTKSEEQNEEVPEKKDIPDLEDFDFGFFDTEPTKTAEPVKQSVPEKVSEPEVQKVEEVKDIPIKEADKTQKEEIKEEKDSYLFRTDIFEQKEEEKEPEVEEQKLPRFSSTVTSDDPDDILKELRARKKAYEQKQMEEEILKAQDTKDLGGTVFDLSTGGSKNGEIDVAAATDKIDKIADSMIQASREDKIADMRMEHDVKEKYTYRIQKESDYERNRNDFILDFYEMELKINGRIEKTRLIIAPIDIPETGTKLVTNICAYLESTGERHSATVVPGGKTTIIIRCEEYSVFIRGSWENGNFISVVSVRGNRDQIEVELKKQEIRPKSMEGIGIGHNVLILDHATTVHIIPISYEDNEPVDFMAVTIRDYGVDTDAESQVSENCNLLIKGELYKYYISTRWENNKYMINSTIE